MPDKNFSDEQKPEIKTESKESKWRKWFKKDRLKIFGGVMAVIIALGVFVWYYFYRGEKILRPHYAQAYTLVSDSISQSANILINLPPGTAKEGMEKNITFTPEIKGRWVENQGSDKVEFDPDEKLNIGKYYTVSLAMAKGNMGKDFLVAEDPEVISVFPKSDSEANENSDITIVFNRPMAPLTSLDVLEKQEIPVEIMPETKGKFKWIGTATLQFIPETHLIVSQNYEVKIKSDFISMDGLKIKEFDHKFITRKLRYDGLHEGKTVYNEPIKINFNQPVDLDRTKEEISMENETTNEKIDFKTEYGIKKLYNKKTKKYDEEEDKATILIFNNKDRFNRGKFWDFNNNYKMTINKAFSEKGDIDLDERREVHIQVGEIIASLSATSGRTGFASPSFFDPEGKLWVEFYETVDLLGSKIYSDKLIGSGYGEKCKGDGDISYGDIECEKEEDKKKVYLIFDKDRLTNSETIKINFNEIKNSAGLKLNGAPVTKEAVVYPKLKILKTIPQNSARNISLIEFIICSNTPITPPAKEDIDVFLKVSAAYEYQGWQHPILVPKDQGGYYKCEVDQFESRINYGLMPETDYGIELKINDNFGQEIISSFNFVTGKMPEKFLNFHHFQKDYNVTTPEKTTLTYAAQNMDFVDVNICQLSPENMLRYLDHRISYTASNETIKECENVITKRINLEPRYWIKNYFKINLADYVENPRGHFILGFSNPYYKTKADPARQIYERTYLTVTNLGIVEKKINLSQYGAQESGDLRDKDVKSLENLYWITNIERLDPVPNARIDLFSSKKRYEGPVEKQKTIYTDKEGIAKTPPINNLRGAVVSVPNDSAIISDAESQFEWANNAYLSQKMYVYTDRPIYRPGDEVHLKGLYRLGYDAAYEIYRDKKINLKIYDSREKEIWSQETQVNDFGTFNADLTLDKASSLGNYRIEADGLGYGSFDVEEYVPSPFKVETKIDKEEYISKDTLNMEIDANYYFGAPVEGGEVEYSIGSQNYHFDKYKDKYFDFGSGWYYCYYDCDYGDQFILRNKAALDSSGKARISHTLDIDKLFKNEEEKKSKIFVIYVTVTNKAGQAVSARKSFIVHAGEFYLGLKSDKSFLGKNEKFTSRLKSVDTEGHNSAVKDINLTLNKVSWVMNKRREVDGGYYYRWEKKLEKIEERTLATDGGGNWQSDFSIKDEGEYEIIAKANDARGNTIKTSYNVYVWGEGYVEVRPSNDNTLEVITDKNSLNVGEKANIIIKSPYEKAKAFVGIERGRIYDYKILDVDKGLYKYSFDIQKSYIPDIYASVVLLSGNPEVKFGKVQFNVNTDEQELSIDVKANNDHYLPGEEVILDFQARDSAGAPIETEFSAAVADLSVLALKGNPKKNPLVFFYGGFPLTVSTISNVKNILYEVNVPAGTKGGGGGEPEDLAKKKRGEFKDTAFWQAVLRTDKNGYAQVKFRLPDNLTTWQVESVGITKDTKLGVSYQEFIARKDVMVVPLKPRFIVPGDEFFIGAQVFNQTNEAQKLEVSFSGGSLILKDDHKKTINVKSGQAEIIYFGLSAPEIPKEGSHSFTLSAKNEKFEDVVEQSIIIRPNDTYETTATAGYSNDKAVEYVYIPPNVIKDKGELAVNHSATLAVFLSDALKYLFAYPYGCGEQVASKLEAIAVVKKGLGIENLSDKFHIPEVEFEGQKYSTEKAVELGLGRLYQNQKSDGGFAYWAQGDSNIYLTLYIAEVMKDLKDAGYEVNEAGIKRAVDFINQRLRYDSDLQKNNNLMIIAAYTLSVLKNYGPTDNAITNRMKSFENDDKFLNESISNESLAYLAILLTGEEKTYGKKFKDKVFKILENRVEIDSRGAFLPTGGNIMWQYYETPVKNSSLLLKALVGKKEENVILDRILRWLLNSRKKDGAWGSTNNTLSAIDAMTDYLKWKKETESNFTLRVLLNEQEKSSFKYDGKTILEQNNFIVPINELGLNSFNRVVFEKENHNNLANNFYYDMVLKYYLPIDSVPPRDEGFSIRRGFYALDDENFEKPVIKARVGDVLLGRLEIVVPKARNFVAIEDFIPAGVELVNFNLETADKSLQGGQEYEWYDETLLRPEFYETHDDRLMAFSENLSPNTYHFEYYVRVLIPGKFNHLPARVSEMYTPENFGRTRGDYFEVKK